MKKQPIAKTKEEKEEKPFIVFRTCKDKCFACNECGYFYGPGHETKAGQPVYRTENK